MTYDPIDTSASDDSADSTVTVDDIDTTVLQGLNLDDAPAGGEVRITEENGQTVFSAGPTLLEDFETDLSAWNGSTGSFNISTSRAKFGSSAVEITGRFNLMYSLPGDGLPAYFPRGNTIRWYTYIGGSNFTSFLFGLSTGSADNSYEHFLNQFGTSVFRKRVNGSTTDFEKPGVGRVLDEWMEIELEFGNSDITATMFREDGSLHATHTITDTEHNGSGIGLRGESGDNWFDHIELL